MKLTQLKRELIRLKEVARNQSITCACQWVEIQVSQKLTKAEKQILERNRACYAMTHDRYTHVGWTSIIVPAQELS